MAELDDLLESAKRADRSERIAWRDPTADHGHAATPMCSGSVPNVIAFHDEDFVEVLT